MERLQLWWKMRFSFRNATMVVCFFNVVAVILLLQGFLSSSSSSSSSSRKLASDQTSSAVYLRYIKESEEIRRALEPLKLIQRLREIEKETYVQPVPVQPKDTKQTAAVALMERLNNFRTFSDTASQKALEEWRNRKMERDRQRKLEKNGTVTTQL